MLDYICVSITESSTNIEYTLSGITPPSAANGPQACNICRRQVSGPDRQNHMGGHILRKLRGIVEHSENFNMGSVSSFRHLSSLSLFSVQAKVRRLKLIITYRSQWTTHADFVDNQA